MKKNMMMRLASVLLVATLLSTCAISGTFAKYVTSAEATDTARVAKWGVEVSATGNDAFSTQYKDETADGGEAVVNAAADVNVVAPGTKGPLAGMSITGKPEVMVDIAVTADLILTGWNIDGGFYCPIVFTVKVNSTTTTINGADYTDVTVLEAAVEDLVTALSATNVAANTDLANSVEISWEWAYGPTDATDPINVKDTKLGNLTTAPTIEFECSVTVTQVD